MSAFGDKDKLLGSLLAPKQTNKGPAIQEIDSNGNVVEKEAIEELELNEDGEFVIPDGKKNEIGATSVDEVSSTSIPPNTVQRGRT